MAKSCRRFSMRTELLGLVVVSLILRLYASDANADNSAPVLDNSGMMSLTGISEDDTGAISNELLFQHDEERLSSLKPEAANVGSNAVSRSRPGSPPKQAGVKELTDQTLRKFQGRQPRWPI